MDIAISWYTRDEKQECDEEKEGINIKNTELNLNAYLH